MNVFLRDDETIEDLQLNQLQLLQKKDGFRYGMDSVLLSHFADIKKNDDVADFCTGSCVIPLLLYGREKGKHYTGIEIQEEIADMAKRTVQINHLENTIHIIQGDASMAPEWISSCSLDAVVCNPPYGIQGKVIISPNSSIAMSRSQGEEKLKSIFKSAFQCLKGKGKFYVVYPASQMLFLMNALQSCHLEPKRFQLVYPFADRPANLVLIEAVKDAKPMLHPMSPLIIYDINQNLTNELKSIYHIK